MIGSAPARRRLLVIGVDTHNDTQTAAVIAATVASLRALARRIQLLNAEIAEHTKAITTLVRAWRPELLSRCGVGPIVAAIVLCAWSTRAAAEATPPSPCWAGPPHPRLQRPDGPGSAQPLRRPPPQPGLHVIVLTRLRYDSATRARPAAAS
jgi:hypothetical protein